MEILTVDICYYCYSLYINRRHINTDLISIFQLYYLTFNIIGLTSNLKLKYKTRKRPTWCCNILESLIINKIKQSHKSYLLGFTLKDKIANIKESFIFFSPSLFLFFPILILLLCSASLFLPSSLSLSLSQQQPPTMPGVAFSSVPSSDLGIFFSSSDFTACSRRISASLSSPSSTFRCCIPLKLNLRSLRSRRSPKISPICCSTSRSGLGDPDLEFLQASVLVAGTVVIISMRLS